MKQVKSLKHSELANWEKRNLSNFTSMRNAYENLTDADKQIIAEQNSNKGYEGFLTLTGSGDDREAVMNADLGFLGTLVSKDGLVQIGEKVTKIGYDEIKTTEKISENELQELMASNWKSVGNRKIETKAVMRSVTPLESARIMDREATCEDRYRKDRRFKAELWVTNAGVYAGTGARAKHQNRFLRVWWADNAPELRLQIIGTFTQVGAIEEFVNYDSGLQSEQNIIEWVFFECGNFACTFEASADVTSSGTGDDGGAHGCSVQ